MLNLIADSAKNLWDLFDLKENAREQQVFKSYVKFIRDKSDFFSKLTNDQLKVVINEAMEKLQLAPERRKMLLDIINKQEKQK